MKPDQVLNVVGGGFKSFEAACGTGQVGTFRTTVTSDAQEEQTCKEVLQLPFGLHEFRQEEHMGETIGKDTLRLRSQFTGSI